MSLYEKYHARQLASANKTATGVPRLLKMSNAYEGEVNHVHHGRERRFCRPCHPPPHL